VERTRTYRWEDPALLAEAAGRMSGIDFLRGLQAGRLPGPPINHAIDFTLDEVEPGRAVFSLTPGEEHYNPIGSVHGGIFATLLDSAAGRRRPVHPPTRTGVYLARPDREVPATDHRGHGQGARHRHGRQQGPSNRAGPGATGRRDGPSARPRHQQLPALPCAALSRVTLDQAGHQPAFTRPGGRGGEQDAGPR
jgi:hypothetical protein